eukprot:COSAG04_NODE_8013_length_1034_cov_1.284492_2_plen_188_part_01
MLVVLLRRIFIVTLIGLVLRIHPDDLAKDPLSEGFGWSGSLYGDLLLVMLVVTALLAVGALFYRSPTEKALRLLQRIAYSDEVPVHFTVLSKCVECLGAICPCLAGKETAMNARILKRHTKRQESRTSFRESVLSISVPETTHTTIHGVELSSVEAMLADDATGAAVRLDLQEKKRALSAAEYQRYML